MRRRLLLGLAAPTLALVLGVGLLFALRVQSAQASAAPTLRAGGGPGPQPQGGPARGWIGLQLASLNEQLAQRLGLEATKGVVVLAVVAGSPAEQAGFQNRDLLQSVDGKEIASLSDVVQAVRAAEPGQELAVVVLRQGAQKTLTVKVGAPPEPAPRAKSGAGPFHRGFRFGLPSLGLRPLPELEGVPKEDLFRRFLGGQFNFLDRDDRPFTVRVLAGIIGAVSQDSITVSLNGGGSATLKITERTQQRPPHRDGATLQAGDQVSITAVGDEARSIIARPSSR